jgi:signal transduction histidine kinase
MQKIATERSTPLPSARTLLLWLVMACLLPAVVGTSALFFHLYQDGRDQLEKTSIATARALVQVVDAELMRAQAVALVLSVSDSLAKGDFAAFHRHASAVLQTTGIGTNIVLSDENGQIVNTLRSYGERLPLHSNMEQVRHVFASGQPFISDIFFGRVIGSHIMAVHVPVLANKRVIYVLSIGILPQQFNQILLNQRLPPAWITTIMDRTGTIAGRTHEADKFVGQKVTPEVFQRMLAAHEGALEAISKEGIPVIVNYSRSPLSHWIVGVGIPRQSLEAALMRTVYLLGLGITLLFGVGVALAWFVGGRISRSVQALTAPAIALEAGKALAVSQVYFREANEVAKAMARTAQLLVKRTQALHKSHDKLEKSEGALLQTRTRLRQLAEHQETIKEGERKRIARDIHDDLGQNLLMLRIDMSMMAARTNLDAVSKKQVDTMLTHTDLTIKAVKTIMNDLRPSVLSLGLHAAVEWQAKEFERRSGIACDLHIDHEEFALDDKLSTALFRIVQESLTNIMRHARASHVQIDMQRRNGQLIVTVADDGIGFFPDCRRKENAFGLIGIEERIDALGGAFSITNNLDRGMTIMVSIPCAVGTSEETAVTL